MTTNTGAIVCRLGGFGDELMAASPLRLLKQKYGHVEFIAQGPKYQVVLENNPFIDKLTTLPVNHIPSQSGEIWQQWFADRAKEVAFLANLSHSCEALLAYPRSLTPFYWPQEVRRKLSDHNYLEMVHDICGVEHKFGPLYFPTEAETQRAVETCIRIGHRPIIGFVLAGSRVDKVYPYSTVLIARLIAELDAAVVMFGAGARDFQFSKDIMEYVEQTNGSHAGLHQAISPEMPDGQSVGRVVEGKTHLVHDEPPEPLWPIRRALATLRACDVVIGPDTGPMWSVAFEHDPKIVLLSHATPTNITRHWINTVALHADQDHVPCWPCHRLHETIETCTPSKAGNSSACMADIPVARILAEVRKALATENVNNGYIIGPAPADVRDGLVPGWSDPDQKAEAAE